MEVVVKSDVADFKQQQQQQPQQHFHVLAVDDSILDRKLLERLLRGSSYEVTCVDSGDEALKYLGLHDDLNQSSTTSSASTSPQSSEVLEGAKVINLIMTDFCMPGMSGYDLLKRVKGSSWKDVPVVVMSSENVPSRINMCLEEGAEEFLLKPLQFSDLKKLQPYLLKSLRHHSSIDSMDNSDDNNVTVKEEVGGGENDQTDQTKSTTEINNGRGNTVNNNILGISKRKAQSVPERSRPTMKGLAVLV